jgi:hypothetical protein
MKVDLSGYPSIERSNFCFRSRQQRLTSWNPDSHSSMARTLEPFRRIAPETCPVWPESCEDPESLMGTEGCRPQAGKVLTQSRHWV